MMYQVGMIQKHKDSLRQRGFAEQLRIHAVVRSVVSTFRAKVRGWTLDALVAASQLDLSAFLTHQTNGRVS